VAELEQRDKDMLVVVDITLVVTISQVEVAVVLMQLVQMLHKHHQV